MADYKRIVVEGIAVYPKITKPDTYGEYADGKFKTGIKVEGAFLKLVQKTIADKAAEQGLTKKYKHALATEDDGSRVVNASSTERPAVFDAKNKRLPADVKIGGGTKLRAQITVAGSKKNNRVWFYLNSIQILDLVEYVSKGGNSDGPSPFGEADGFAYDGEEASGDDSPFNGDEDSAEDAPEGSEDPYAL